MRNRWSLAPTVDVPANMSVTNNMTNYTTTKQAAEMLGVGQRHILHLLTIGKVQGIKLGHDWIVFAPSLQEYYKTKSSKGRPASRLPQLQSVG